MIDHVGVEVRDFEKSRKFYETALAPLGIKLLMVFEQFSAAGFGEDRPRFWIGGGKPEYGVDEFHLCFSAKTRAEVRAFYDAAIRAGGKDNGKPGLRPEYHEDYYAAFVLDPDGNGLEASCRTKE
jgi:catechol 2,3-dioxygenase-like lactoylglutathione lyase family enzyme